MGSDLASLRLDFKAPWFIAILLTTLMPLFPEYISFPLIFAAAYFAYRDIRAAHRPIRIGLLGKLLLAYIGYMLITLIYSGNRRSTLLTVAMWAAFFLVYLIMNNLLTDTERFDTLMLCITAVAGAVGLIACCQYRIGFFTHGNPIRVWDWLDGPVYSLLNIEVSKIDYVLRACSTFSNPNVLSIYLTSAMPFVMYYNFYERRENVRLFSRVCLCLTYGGVIFSFCRGGYIAILLLSLALIALNIRHRFATVGLYVISALLLIPDEVVERMLTILPGISSGEHILSRLTSSSVAYTTTAEIINSAETEVALGERWRVWLEALNCFKERPVFGYGAGVHTCWDILREHHLGPIHTHNIVLQLLMEGGLILLIIMLLIGFKVVKNGIELIRDGYSTSFWVGFAVIGFAACFCIQGMVDYPLLTPKLVCHFVMTLGIIERSISLYHGHGIPVRQHIRHRLLRKKQVRE